MTTATNSPTHREQQPNAPLAEDGVFNLIYDPFLSRYLHPVYPVITADDSGSADQTVINIAGGPQARSRWIACYWDPWTLAPIRSTGREKARWGNPDPGIIFINQGVTSVAAEPQFRTTFTIFGGGSAPSDEVQLRAESATAVTSPTPASEMLAKLASMFDTAGEETFADGMDSDFSRMLHSIVRTYGSGAINEIGRTICSEGFDVEVAGEALRQIGSVDHLQSRRSRLSLLLSALESPDPRLRDAASIGIATVDDPTAIEGMRSAMERETSLQVGRNLEMVLEQLQATQRWLTS